MKSGGGRKKSEPKHLQQDESETSPPAPAPTPTPPQPPIKGDEEQIYGAAAAAEVEEDEEEEDEQGEDEEEDEQRPKLAEGFFEIEAVRAKRTRKGQRQYLIKWRGWPDTANTWEPIHNLQSCSDIIQAFEQRSSKSYRKRKRKHNNFHTQTKKKQQQRPTTSNSTSTDQPNNHTSLSNSTLPSPHLPHEGVEAGKAEESTDHTEDKDSAPQGLDNVNVTHHLLQNGTTDIATAVDDNQPKQTTEADHDTAIQPMPSSNGLDIGRISIQVADSRSLEKDDGVDDQSKAETSIRFIGAKRRKSGRVKRIKQDQVLPALDEARPSVETAVNGPHLQSQEPNLGDEANLGNSINPSSIAQIIEPVGFSTSVFNNVHDVSLTFRAVRSDGQETQVDNNFLKVHNPLLLINYYEQHLRYTPPT